MNGKVISHKIFSTTIVVFLALLIVSAAVSLVTPMVSAAGASITLSSSQGAAGSSVNVTGTGFAANSAVGIGFGAEVAVIGENVPGTISGSGPFTATSPLAKSPVKPGTFIGTVYPVTFTDDGAGNIIESPTLTNWLSGTINYATGQTIMVTTTSAAGTLSASYATYANNVSPTAGIITNASGSFTAKITIPNVSNGNYVVTAISAQGNVATSTFTVAAAAPTLSISLSPSQGSLGSSVNVTGTMFAANSTVGIGFGAEVAVNGESVNETTSGSGPYTNTATIARTPIKPGTFILNVLGLYNITDNGTGALIRPPSGGLAFISGTLNYVTGQLISNTTVPGAGGAYNASYTTYGNNVSPGAGITTNASGSFTAKITIPNVSNGNYVVTAIDTLGNVATSTFTVADATPTPTPIAVPTPTPSPTSTPTTAQTPSPTPAAVPTAVSTAAPTPAATPSPSPSPSPSLTVPEFSGQLLAITLFISMVMVLSAVIIARKRRTEKIQAEQISHLA